MCTLSLSERILGWPDSHLRPGRNPQPPSWRFCAWALSFRPTSRRPPLPVEFGRARPGALRDADSRLQYAPRRRHRCGRSGKSPERAASRDRCHSAWAGRCPPSHKARRVRGSGMVIVMARLRFHWYSPCRRCTGQALTCTPESESYTVSSLIEISRVAWVRCGRQVLTICSTVATLWIQVRFTAAMTSLPAQIGTAMESR